MINAGKKQTYKAGLKAERIARWYLRLKGYRILATRFKKPVGEVDIIARRGKTLIFVEVKARAQMDDALYAVTGHQRQRIEKAASIYLQENPRMVTDHIRFDVIIIVPGRWPRHLKAAWGP